MHGNPDLIVRRCGVGACGAAISHRLPFSSRCEDSWPVVARRHGVPELCEEWTECREAGADKSNARFDSCPNRSVD